MDEEQQPVAGIQQLRAISWDAPEHNHTEKGAEWFIILAIITGASAFAAFLFENYLFGSLLILAGITITIVTLRPPAIITYSVTNRGVRVDDQLYPYASLEAYHIDEEDANGPQLLLRADRLTMPLIVIPLPEEELDDIQDLISEYLPNEHLEEPLITKVLEFLGF